MNEARRCPYCQSSFLPSRYRPQQRVCRRPDCQRQRRANSRLQKLATDVEYRQVVRDSQKQWRTVQKLCPTPAQNWTAWEFGGQQREVCEAAKRCLSTTRRSQRRRLKMIMMA